MSDPPRFTCQRCGSSFDVSAAVLERYPNWIPKLCLKCRKTAEADVAPKRRAAKGQRASGSTAHRSAPDEARRELEGGERVGVEENLTIAEVLAKYTDGPSDGVFTDGASHPNPGPGGWGAVYVVAGAIQAERWGDAPDTTNNRMELTALIEGCKLVPPNTRATLWTDSQLCVKTINEWAKAWEARGWKRSSGEVKNLDLVQELYRAMKARPELTLRWIKAHSGFRWNEYADALATAYRRSIR